MRACVCVCTSIQILCRDSKPVRLCREWEGVRKNCSPGPEPAITGPAWTLKITGTGFPKSLFPEKVQYNVTCLHFSDYSNCKRVITPALVSIIAVYRWCVLSLLLRSLTYTGCFRRNSKYMVIRNDCRGFKNLSYTIHLK